MNNKYMPWVKKLGQAHIALKGGYETLCGKPMLGNNYAGVFPLSHQNPCEECYSKLSEVTNEDIKKHQEKNMA